MSENTIIARAQLAKTMERPHLPGCVILTRDRTANQWRGVVEHSFSMDNAHQDRVLFWWSSKNATSNLGGNFEVDGFADAASYVRKNAPRHPGLEFAVFDVHDEDKLPIVIDWDEWREAGERSDKTLSGVKDKFRRRNPRFWMKE
jgi:hypothetical protein